jgi:hypothetical protein
MMKEIQYHDYKLTTKSTQCTDSVTEPCVDNVFSFFAKECVWVLKAGRVPSFSEFDAHVLRN